MQKFLLTVAASVFLLLFAGCGKHADATTQQSQQAFNAVQFFNDFAAAPPELKALADKAWRSIQSGAFPAALNCLDKLDADPSLTGPQKQSVAALRTQVEKQLAATTAAK